MMLALPVSVREPGKTTLRSLGLYSTVLRMGTAGVKLRIASGIPDACLAAWLRLTTTDGTPSVIPVGWHAADELQCALLAFIGAGPAHLSQVSHAGCRLAYNLRVLCRNLSCDKALTPPDDAGLTPFCTLMGNRLRIMGQKMTRHTCPAKCEECHRYAHTESHKPLVAVNLLSNRCLVRSTAGRSNYTLRCDDADSCRCQP